MAYIIVPTSGVKMPRSSGLSAGNVRNSIGDFARLARGRGTAQVVIGAPDLILSSETSLKLIRCSARRAIGP